MLKLNFEISKARSRQRVVRFQDFLIIRLVRLLRGPMAINAEERAKTMVIALKSALKK
jgi:hypothetical protein